MRGPLLDIRQEPVPKEINQARLVGRWEHCSDLLKREVQRIIVPKTSILECSQARDMFGFEITVNLSAKIYVIESSSYDGAADPHRALYLVSSARYRNGATCISQSGIPVKPSFGRRV